MSLLNRFSKGIVKQKSRLAAMLVLFGIIGLGATVFAYTRSTIPVIAPTKPTVAGKYDTNNEDVIDDFVGDGDQKIQDSKANGEEANAQNQDQAQVKPAINPITAEPVNSTSKYRQFTGQQFVDFYNSVSYSNVSSIATKPYITGDQKTDAYIQSMAEKRGYRLRGESLTGTYQPELNNAIKNLQAAASKEAGLNFVLVSGYRSISDQRGLFLGELDDRGVNRSQIITGSEDAAIEATLTTRSIPGYSKHHTGYTVDFGCNNYDLLSFKSSTCYQWISANNYENAKRFGLIPSYPDGAAYQGPDPEEWEYVWVGEQRLLR